MLAVLVEVVEVVVESHVVGMMVEVMDTVVVEQNFSIEMVTLVLGL